MHLVQADLETMVVDQLHDGWLSESLISAVLIMFIHIPYTLTLTVGRPRHDL